MLDSLLYKLTAGVERRCAAGEVVGVEVVVRVCGWLWVWVWDGVGVGWGGWVGGCGWGGCGGCVVGDGWDFTTGTAPQANVDVLVSFCLVGYPRLGLQLQVSLAHMLC